MATPRRASTFLLAGTLVAGCLEAQVWEVGNLLLRPHPSVVGTDADFRFGQSLVAADFDLDGADDLVVGAPSGDNPVPPGAEESGWVHVFWGGADRQLTFATYIGGGFDFGALGLALAAGDFDGDGRPELAMGHPGADVGGVDGAGAVWIRRYDGSQWSWAGAFDQDTPGVPGAAEAHDLFGMTLATGDFDGDGRDDLAVGVPYEDRSATDDGALVVLYGSPSGLDADGAGIFSAGVAGVLGLPGDEDLFGWSLAAGDFDHDGWDDLAVGVPFRDVAGVSNNGQVHVLYGSPVGLRADVNQLFTDYDFGSQAEPEDWFGFALAAANFDRPAPADCAASDPPDACADDLVIGVPGQAMTPPGGTPQASAGKVLEVPGKIATGLSPSLTRLFSQIELPGAAPEAGDGFGRVLATGQLDARRGAAGSRLGADLVVGVPYEDVSGRDDQGLAHLVFGGPFGLGEAESQVQLERPGLASSPAAADDLFGSSLAVGDFDGDGWDDLAVGVPMRDDVVLEDLGAVQILYGGLFADGFGAGDASGWSATEP